MSTFSGRGINFALFKKWTLFSSCAYSSKCRGLFRTQSNIYDGVLVVTVVIGFKTSTVLAKNLYYRCLAGV